MGFGISKPPASVSARKDRIAANATGMLAATTLSGWTDHFLTTQGGGKPARPRRPILGQRWRYLQHCIACMPAA